MHLNPLRDVLPTLRDPRAARQLLTHVRTQQTTRDGGSYKYLNPLTGALVGVRGLTAALRQLYWPDYNPWATGGRRGAKKPKKPRGVGKKRAPKTAQQAARSHVRGSLVHRQVAELWMMDAAAFQVHNPDGVHPWAWRLYEALIARGWRPLASEYIVFDEAMRIGTALDMVAVTPAGRLVFLEFKTGESRAAFGQAERASPWMHGPLGHVKNSARNRALVQLMVGTMLAVRGLGITDEFEAWVVHVDAEQVDFIALDRVALLAVGPAVWNDMLARLPRLWAKQAAAKKQTPPTRAPRRRGIV